MKRKSFIKLNRKSGMVVLCFASLSLLAAGGGGGHERADTGRDRAGNASAGDPVSVTNDAVPIFGTEDKKDGAKGAVKESGKNDRQPESISQEAGRGMLSEFQRAQSTEVKALEHRNKIELKELKASQSARSKEWETHEKEVRHKFFAEHRNGPDRRAYVTNFVSRHKDFDQSLKDELKQKVTEQDARVSGLRADQAARLKEFKSALEHGERPPASLWPTAS